MAARGADNLMEKWAMKYFIERDPDIKSKIDPALSNGVYPDFIAHINSHGDSRPASCPFCVVLKKEETQ